MRQAIATLVLLGCGLVGQSAQAQPAGGASVSDSPGAEPGRSAPPQQETSVYMARELWKQGVAAFERKDYPAARIAFEKCYGFMPKVEVLRNLAISEVESGAFVSAIGHLKTLLGPDNDVAADVRDKLEALLTRSMAQVGQLSITTPRQGAEIWVDGTHVGQSPLAGLWFVEPGRHTVRLENDSGPDTSRRVYALAGVPIPVEFEQVASRPIAQRQVGLSPERPLLAPPLATGVDSQQLAARDTALVIGGGILSAAALAGATYYTSRAYQDGAEAEAITQRLQNALPNSSGICAEGSQFVVECGELNDRRQSEARNSNRARAATIGFGAAATATLSYALYLAFRRGRVAPSVSPMVELGAGNAAIGFQGQF